MKPLATDLPGTVRLLRAHPVFAPLSDESVKKAAEGARVRRYDAGEILLDEGEDAACFWVLVEGAVGVYYRGQTRAGDVLVKIFDAPSCFGEMEMLAEIPRIEMVEAFEPCKLVVLPTAAFEQVFRNDAEACWQLAKNLARCMIIIAFHERALVHHSIEERLAATLLSFLEAYGETRADGRVALKRKVTQEMLARCLGTATRSVERALKKWQDDGLVEREGAHYVFSSHEALRAQTDPKRLLLYSRLDVRVRSAAESGRDERGRRSPA
jgi:CRP-like cAMP-binding protein